MVGEPPGVETNPIGFESLCATSRLLLLENVHTSLCFAPCHGSYALNGWCSGTESHPCRCNSDKRVQQVPAEQWQFCWWPCLTSRTGRVGHTVQCCVLAFYDLLWGIVHDCRVLTWPCWQFWELYNDLLIQSFLLTPNFSFL